MKFESTINCKPYYLEPHSFVLNIIDQRACPLTCIPHLGEERGLGSADLVSFSLELSFHATEEVLSKNVWFHQDLAGLGRVKLQQGRKESWFIRIKLATNLSISLSDTSSRKQGYVVVETNFRMYAYSSSKLHCEILRLFSRCEVTVLA
ncbi:unnamed protein product [Coffea canephora]|uniref:RNA polymerase II transcription factor B subunit 2 n=1 Tax=Coffea canephora TaxID=49390 RepID=A0A068UN81_COFCA|nr:unnamed protein product [Coffea canephora]